MFVLQQGAPNCLKDHAFLLTGVLDSFERDEVVDTIKKYGGEIKSGISKKVSSTANNIANENHIYTLITDIIKVNGGSDVRRNVPTAQKGRAANFITA